MKRGPGSLFRKLQSIRYLATRDRRAATAFLSDPLIPVPRSKRIGLIARFIAATNAVRGYHTLTEMLTVTTAILARERPTVLEAGCGYGASTAKLSLAVSLARGSLIVCDTFRGMPENDERHRLMDGRATAFRAGAFRGRLGTVERNVTRWGAPSVCRFEKGLVQDTLPRIDERPDVVVMDVDLVASTRACLRELWPRLGDGAVVFSLDGQLRATHELLADARFWQEEVGCLPPRIDGLGHAKLLTLLKDQNESTKPSP